MQHTKPTKLEQILPMVNNSHISPEDLEDALYYHPAVLEACVVGIRDPVHDEKLIAFVALRDGIAAGEQELRDLIRGRVADYITLEHFVFLPSLPKESTGKVARNTLKDQASAIPTGFDSFAYNSIYHDGPASHQGPRQGEVTMQNTNPAPQEQILPIVLGFWQARALAVATELGLADLLAEGSLHVDELASRTNTNSSALFRLLRALESVGLFAQASPGVFSNSAMSECLRKEVPGSQWPTVVHCLSKGSGPFEGWDELEYAVRTGGPSVEKTYGHDFWELLRCNPQASTAMNGALRSASVAMTPAVTAAYAWRQFPVIADIGGGIGTQLVSILEASPASKGILFDKLHLRAESIPHDRIQVIDGDFFESVPTGADAYLLRFILHDWDDADAVAILGSVRRAMKPTARLIFIESVIPTGPEFNFGKWTDLQMLVCVGGRERTETEYRALLSTAGFDLQEVVATASPLSLLIAKPM